MKKKNIVSDILEASGVASASSRKVGSVQQQGMRVKDFPNLTRFLEEMGFDNDMRLNKEYIIPTGYEGQMMAAEQAATFIGNKRCGDIIPGHDWIDASPNDGAMETVTMGEMTDSNAILSRIPNGQVLDNILNEFFQGKFHKAFGF